MDNVLDDFLVFSKREERPIVIKNATIREFIRLFIQWIVEQNHSHWVIFNAGMASNSNYEFCESWRPMKSRRIFPLMVQWYLIEIVKPSDAIYSTDNGVYLLSEMPRILHNIRYIRCEYMMGLVTGRVYNERYIRYVAPVNATALDCFWMLRWIFLSCGVAKDLIGAIIEKIARVSPPMIWGPGSAR
jgi:hypothetical protein